jgi:hypothetical protein
MVVVLLSFSKHGFWLYRKYKNEERYMYHEHESYGVMVMELLSFSKHGFWLYRQ